MCHDSIARERVTGLWERTSKTGGTYLKGGGYVLFPNASKTKPCEPDYVLYRVQSPRHANDNQVGAVATRPIESGPHQLSLQPIVDN